MQLLQTFQSMLDLLQEKSWRSSYGLPIKLCDLLRLDDTDDDGWSTWLPPCPLHPLLAIPFHADVCTTDHVTHESADWNLETLIISPSESRFRSNIDGIGDVPTFASSTSAGSCQLPGANGIHAKLEAILSRVDALNSSCNSLLPTTTLPCLAGSDSVASVSINANGHSCGSHRKEDQQIVSDQSSLVFPELPSCKRELTLLQEISYPKTNDFACVHDKRHVRPLVCNVVHRAWSRAQLRTKCSMGSSCIIYRAIQDEKLCDDEVHCLHA